MTNLPADPDAGLEKGIRIRRFGIDLFGFTKWNTIGLNSERIHGKLV